MRGVSSCLFRRFTQDKSIFFQEGARVSGGCRLGYFPGLIWTKVSLPPPRQSRSDGSAHVGANSGASWADMGPTAGANAVSAVESGWTRCGTQISLTREIPHQYWPLVMWSQTRLRHQLPSSYVVHAEACLAHVAKGVEASYQRSDLFEHRRLVMQKWSDYITGAPTADVIPLHG